MSKYMYFCYWHQPINPKLVHTQIGTQSLIQNSKININLLRYDQNMIIYKKYELFLNCDNLKQNWKF